MSDVKTFLEKHQIRYEWHEHPAVYTVAEAAEKAGGVPGVRCKNLFLKTKRTPPEFYLVMVPVEKRVDMKALGKVFKTEFTFGSADELHELLGLTPGAVSPLGLMNDAAGRVHLVVAHELMQADCINIHPNTNTASLTLQRVEFQKLLVVFAHPPQIILVPYIV